MDRAMDGRHDLEAFVGADVRVCLPRGELRVDRHPPRRTSRGSRGTESRALIIHWKVEAFSQRSGELRIHLQRMLGALGAPVIAIEQFDMRYVFAQASGPGRR